MKDLQEGGTKVSSGLMVNIKEESHFLFNNIINIVNTKLRHVLSEIVEIMI